ncbi:hypothetical protein Tsubulata_026825 [Turnera subulata]|uniref:Glycosyltransferase n=1 Tax=Turnera subulata TaxID=218843 RepID=A0A9Q0F5Y2_9ROSI|nr:hypothetical protein Tsubulata_026825 [Turnera subulata]
MSKLLHQKPLHSPTFNLLALLALLSLLLILGIVFPWGRTSSGGSLFSPSESSSPGLSKWRHYTLPEAAAFVAKNGTVIVCAVSHPWLPFLNNWLISLSRQKQEDKVLVVAEDYATLFEVNERWPGHAVLVPPAPDSQTAAHDYGSQGFFNFTSRRPRHLLQILELGYNVMYNDVDMVWLGDPFAYMEGSHDVYFMDDMPAVKPLDHSHDLPPPVWKNGPPNVCSCLIFLRPTGGAKLVLKKWIEEVQAQHWSKAAATNDQPAFNWALLKSKGQADLYLLPQAAFPTGGLYFGNTRWVEETKGKHVIIHNNYIKGFENKQGDLCSTAHPVDGCYATVVVPNHHPLTRRRLPYPQTRSSTTHPHNTLSGRDLLSPRTSSNSHRHTPIFFNRTGLLPLLSLLLILGVVFPRARTSSASESSSSLSKWRRYTLPEAASFVAKNGTIIVCAVSHPYLPLLNNRLISVSRQKQQDKVLVIAEDHATLFKVNERWPGHAVLVPPAPDSQTAHDFGSQIKPLDHSHDLPPPGNKGRPYVCSCMIFLRPTNGAKLVMKKWIEELQAQPSSKALKASDQPAFNWALNKTAGQVDLYLLPQAAFPTGGLYFTNKTWVEETKGKHIIIHNSYIRGFENKMKRFRDYGLWLVDDHANESPLGKL